MAQRQYHTLTKRTVDRLSVNGKDAVFWDDELPGFGVRVYPSGKKVFVVQTRAFGRSKRISLGTHGDPHFSVDHARKKATDISAMTLHRQLGISYNAAWRMRHKLMQVMMERDRVHPLGGIVELDDAYLGGERSGGKRGRGAPGKTPFVAAVETNDEGHPLRMKLTVVEGFRLTEIAAWAQPHLGTGTQVVSDGLACFNAVTAAGCVHEPVVTGAGKPRSSVPSSVG